MILTTNIILGAIGACWVYNDAKNRGRDTKVAFLWSAGVVAQVIIFLPLYLFFGRKQKLKPVPAIPNNFEIIEVEATPVEETIPCPMCAGRVKEDFKLCPYCGHTLRPECRKCGKSLSREWRVCPYCQTPADDK